MMQLNDSDGFFKERPDAFGLFFTSISIQLDIKMKKPL